MAMTFAINPETGDLQVNKKGALQIVYGADEVKQRILIALQHFYHEYFLNIPAGVPWYELILGSKDHKLADALLRRTVLLVPGVVSIISSDFNFSDRKLAISMTVDVKVLGVSNTVIIKSTATTTNAGYLAFTFGDGSYVAFGDGRKVAARG